MMKKIVTMAASVLGLALLAVSCIYPFTPETVDGSGTLVVDGDIFIGEFTTVTLSYAAPIGRELEYAYPSAAEVWVEDDEGTTFNGQKWKSGSGDDEEVATFRIDTRNADPSRNYRLHVRNNSDGKEYVSSWERVCSAPVIDSLSYILDYDRSRLNVALSMHSGSESYYKWDYVEDWEYHALYNAILKLDVQTTYYWNSSHTSVNVRAMDYDKENLYYCYGHNVSKNIMTFSTEKQTDDRFVDLEFRPINRDDLKLSYIYRIKVSLEPLSRDAYDFWENMKTNSDSSGDLFTPNPSETVGNIRCVDDPDVFVLGYINVAQRATKTLVLRQEEHLFFKRKETFPEMELISSTMWKDYYELNFLPYTWYIPNDVSQTYWLPDRCVDCMKRGDSARDISRNKPEDWPPKEQ